MQEYEDVIGQLRDDNRLLSTLNETLRDLIRTRNEGDVDALAQKCLQLRDKISVLEKSISVKETLLNALCKQKQQQQQQQPRDLSGTQQQRLQSDDERVNQLLVDFVKLKQKYAESTDKYRQQIELLQRQVSRQAASTSQQREPVHFSVAEVGEDVPAKTQSADIDVVSVDIIRPPPSSQPPPVNVTSPASYGVGASGGTQLPRQPNDAVLTCPRCEREFAAHEDQLFMTHCVRCIDD